MRHLFAALIAALLPAAAVASTMGYTENLHLVRYELRGSKITGCDPYIPVWYDPCPTYLGIGSFDGDIWIDERALGFQIAGTTMRWGGVNPGSTKEDWVGNDLGLSRFDLPYFGERFYNSVGLFLFELETDGDRHPVKWSITVNDVLRDDIVLGSFGFAPFYADLHGSVGTIVLAPIPLPPAAALSLAGLLGLAFFHLRSTAPCASRRR
jgi:hypothetical protein